METIVKVSELDLINYKKSNCCNKEMSLYNTNSLPINKVAFFLNPNIKDTVFMDQIKYTSPKLYKELKTGKWTKKINGTTHSN